MEKAMLTREEIEIAKKDRSHLVVKAIDSIGEEHWKNIFNKFGHSTQEEVYSAAIPLAERIYGQEFSLMPLDLISIWGRMIAVVENLHTRYAIANSIGLSYCSYPFKSNEWACNFKTNSEMYDHLSELARKEPDNARIFLQRLDDVFGSRDEISFYYHGTREKISDLVNAAISGNSEAMKKCDAAIARNKEINDPVIYEVLENSARICILGGYVKDGLRSN